MLIDTHAHLDDPQFAADLEDVVERAAAADVQQIITVGTDLGTSRAAASLAEAHATIAAAVGVHPHDAATVDDRTLGGLGELADRPQVVAIGEIGLDYYRDRSPRAVQKQVFRAQVELALERELPVILHNRDSTEDCLSILDSYRHSGLRGVAHCFSGDAAALERFLNLGFHVSFAGNVTFKSAADLKSVARLVPADRLLLETDCPYLAPQPVRGKRNEPAYVRYVLHELAGLLGTPSPELAAITTRNAQDLFHLEGSRWHERH